ncbi:FtsX-like permease family protein [Micromonospora aurantiaca (nom. illeg.)]|uniref:FtsX-like permease family protein n=1 Tax=Micromonospora aurantiaca (nom. illeg.) TaxID=47850 RepID=UPI0033FCB578
MALSQIRGQAGRSVTLWLGIVLTAVGVLQLTAIATTTRLDAVGQIQQNARPAYDILVRPTNSRLPVEKSTGLIRPNHLSGLHGGITDDQWEEIRRLPGVEVAAPVAMLGYASSEGRIDVDLGDAIDRSRTRQIIRVLPTWVADTDLTRVPERNPRYVYVTKRPVAVPETIGVSGTNGQQSYRAPDGTRLTYQQLWDLGCSDRQVPNFYLEQQENGSWKPLCGTWQLNGKDAAWFAANRNDQGSLSLAGSRFSVIQALQDGTFLNFADVVDPARASGDQEGVRHEPVRSNNPTLSIIWPIWLPVAAIDPGQEAQLMGLDQALSSGSYLAPAKDPGCAAPSGVPAIAPDRVDLDERLSVNLARVAGERPIAGQRPADLAAELRKTSVDHPANRTYSVSDAYAAAAQSASGHTRLDVIIQASAPDYVRRTDGQLTPQFKQVDAGSWRTSVSRYGETATGAAAGQPELARDNGFRELSNSAEPVTPDAVTPPIARWVGSFDPNRIRRFSPLSAVPLETYLPMLASGADDKSAALMGGKALRASSNPAGYSTAPASMLIPISMAKCVVKRTDPISAVRVRVRDVTGVDPVSMERVRVVASTIADRTGLDVDVTLGASPQAQTVVLPAGQHGRPELALTEYWAKPGAVLTVIETVERKNVLFTGIAGIAGVLFLLTNALAAANDRRRDLAVLARFGWSRKARLTLLLAETSVLSVAAGLAVATVLTTLRFAVERPVNWVQAAGVIAIAAAMHFIAVVGTVAGTGEPGWAPHRRSRRSRRQLQTWTMAIDQIAGARSRTAVTLGSMTVAAAATLITVALVKSTDRAMVGTLLGEAISLRAGPSDRIMITLVGGLSFASVAIGLRHDLRERTRQLALLLALGWHRRTVVQLIVLELAALALAATVTGCGAVVLALALVEGAFPASVAALTPAVLGTTMVLAMAAASIALLSRRTVSVAEALRQ